MEKLILGLLLLTFFLSACSSSDENNPWNYQEIEGRNMGALYQIRIPKDWQRKDRELGESIIDTKKPLCEFFVDNDIRITIHNFPSQTIDDRIPTIAQISRWQKQFESINESDISITPQAFSGYSGQLFEGEGVIEGKHTSVMGWAMQLGADQYRQLLFPEHSPESRADVTIKVVGSPNAIRYHHDDITTFARSFELINEIPIQR